MPLPQLPDGPEKPFPPAPEPVPANAHPQSELLLELWTRARRERSEYWCNVETMSDRERAVALSALESTQSAVVAVLHHLYGVPRVDAQVRVQLALGNDAGTEALL
jgi:hypothetical protein